MTQTFQKAMDAMIAYNAPDVRRINHALKVFSFTQSICCGEKVGTDVQLIAGLCGLLHDIGIHAAERKYHSSAGSYQELEGPAQAEPMLAAYNLPREIRERILFIIGHHHSYSNIDGLDFQILVEADFLVNIYEDEMKRDEILACKSRLFRTARGMELLDALYLSSPG